MPSSKGFGLIEIMLAMTLGLIMSLALTQVLVTAKSTYLTQSSSANLQEDARFVLSKLVQETRMAGLSACLAKVEDASQSGSFHDAINEPVRWEPARQTLTLITADAGLDNSSHTWEVHSDCDTFAIAYSRANAPAPAAGVQAFYLHRQVYRFNPARAELSLNGQPLLSHVMGFDVLFGVANGSANVGIARYTRNPDPERVRSLRLTLTLGDPDQRVKAQTFTVVGALRNRLG